jgi:thiamine pyrophosphokinase
MKKCLILANGQPPKKNVFNFLFKKGYNTLICADGGANSAYKLNLIPDFIIGDLDSIHPKVKKYYSRKSRIIRYSRQSDTDVEKCLKYAVKNKFTEVILLGATGDRLDHTFCNLGIALKFFDKINTRILHQKSLLSVFENKVELDTIKGELISIYGFDKKTKLTSRGLKYPLKKSALPFGEKESTSNVATGKKVEIKIHGGKIFIIREIEKLRENGLF